MSPFIRLLLGLLCLTGALVVHAAEDVQAQIQTLEERWAEAFYRLPAARQTAIFKDLLVQIRALERRHPAHAEPLILEAIVLCTLAAADWGWRSLGWLEDARRLLVRAIDLDPKAMHGSAYLTLGNLYHRLPGWPLSYGDDELARHYLESAHRLFPDALDSNYFLGDFWLHQKQYEKALVYLERAERAPIRPSQRLSDEKIKQEVQVALEAARRRKAPHADFFADLLPSFD